jgi:hypothetical protein
LNLFSPNNKLRIAVMRNATIMEAWQIEALQELFSLDFVEPVLVIEEFSPIKKGSLKSKFKKLFGFKSLFYFYDRYVFNPKVLQAQSSDELFFEVPIISCAVIKKGVGEYFQKVDIDQIALYKPDIIIRFGFNILKGEILSVARYGVWSYHHGDEQKYRGGPAGFWEIINKDPVTGVILQKLTEELDAGVVLKKGFFKTEFKSYSDQFDDLFRQSVSWLKEACVELNIKGEDFINRKPSESTAPIYKFPTNSYMLRLFGVVLIEKIKFHYRELFLPEKWNIGILKQSIEDLVINPSNSSVGWISAEKRGIYNADPFGFSAFGRNYILYEDFDYKNNKGKISAIPIEGGEKEVLLETDYHLSYPYVFEHEGETFMIPESFQANKLILYKYNKSNGKWEDYCVLLEQMQVIDPSLIHHNEKWWLFCTLADKNPNTNLFLFYSDKLEGPYISHALNPVKTDIRSARPAGSIFFHDNDIIRPGQDCSETYGGAVVFNKICTINPFDYKEQEIGRLNPEAEGKYKYGLHTISRLNGFTLVDGKTYEFSSSNFKRQLIRKIRKFI